MVEEKQEHKQAPNLLRVRYAVRYLYDIQKLRIQTGNRKLEDEEEEETPSLEEEEVEEGFATFAHLTKEDKEFLGKQSDNLKDLEKQGLAYVAKVLKGIPIYDNWLKIQPGCGPALSGIILSEINIHKAPTVSALWSYCGLAVGSDGKAVRMKRGDVGEDRVTFNRWVKSKLVQVLADGLIKADGKLKKKSLEAAVNEQWGPDWLKSPAYAEFLQKNFTEEELKPLKSGSKWKVNNVTLLRVIEVNNIPWNYYPTKWRQFYNNYKQRKENTRVPVCMCCKGTGISPYEEDDKKPKNGEAKKEKKDKPCANCDGKGKNAPWGNGPMHRNRAANRYMIKMFLQELWKEWRAAEGLPIPPPYAEAYLNRVHGDHAGALA